MTLPLFGTIASWRLSFLAVGLPGLLLVLWLLTVKECLRKNLLRSADGRTANLSLRETFSQVSQRWKSVSGISFAMIFQSTCTFAFVGCAPKHGSDRWGASVCNGVRLVRFAEIAATTCFRFRHSPRRTRWKSAWLRERRLSCVPEPTRFAERRTSSR